MPSTAPPPPHHPTSPPSWDGFADSARASDGPLTTDVTGLGTAGRHAVSHVLHRRRTRPGADSLLKLPDRVAADAGLLREPLL
jgi:hypothetical protein